MAPTLIAPPEPALPRRLSPTKELPMTTTYSHGIWDVTHVAETGSTNADILADAAHPHAAVIVADYQDAGRGRMSRHWVAPAGSSLALSAGWRVPAAQTGTIWAIPLAVGLALTDVIPGAELKWPNDVLLAGKKVCGILCEAETHAAGAYVAIGIGTNVSLTREQLPVPHATSLELEGITVDKESYIAALLDALAARLQQWSTDLGALLADYRAHCSTIGKQVRVDTPAGPVTGTATGVDDSGNLVVGGTHIAAGDVHHVRGTHGSYGGN